MSPKPPPKEMITKYEKTQGDDVSSGWSPRPNLLLHDAPPGRMGVACQILWPAVLLPQVLGSDCPLVSPRSRDNPSVSPCPPHAMPEWPRCHVVTSPSPGGRLGSPHAIGMHRLLGQQLPNLKRSAGARKWAPPTPHNQPRYRNTESAAVQRPSRVASGNGAEEKARIARRDGTAARPRIAIGNANEMKTRQPAPTPKSNDLAFSRILRRARPT